MERGELRENEVAVDLPPPGDAALRFLGTICTPWPDRNACPRRGDTEDGPDCLVVLSPEWAGALSGLERYERIEILYWLHLSRRDVAVQTPGRDGRTLGTFSLRSPLRPNPIGVSRVRLVGIEGATLTVRGLDCVDGTPLLDLKPDHCAFTTKAPPKG